MDFLLDFQKVNPWGPIRASPSTHPPSGNVTSPREVSIFHGQAAGVRGGWKGTVVEIPLIFREGVGGWGYIQKVVGFGIFVIPKTVSPFKEGLMMIPKIKDSYSQMIHV